YRKVKMETDAALERLNKKRTTLSQRQHQTLGNTSTYDKPLDIVSLLQDEEVSTEGKRAAFKAVVEKVVYNKPNDSLSLFLIDEE
ncbi:hypothetical protein, partial [Anaerotignum propionicum]